MGQVALAQIDTLFENLEDVSDEQLDVLERKIASKYMGIVPWGCLLYTSDAADE